MTVPPQYSPWFAALGFNEISFGSTGFRIFSPEELEEAQVGYSRSAQGQSFCDGADGSWKPEWLVIAYDTGLGDPIFLDTSASAMPVLAAMHGEGSWEPRVIARSLEDFAAALRAFREVAVGREHPVALEGNPLSPEERDRALQQIRGAAAADELDLDFWQAMLD